MSESREVNDGEEKPPLNDDDSIGWLEHLASKPDAIWPSASHESESGSDQVSGAEASQLKEETHGQEDPETTSKSAVMEDVTQSPDYALDEGAESPITAGPVTDESADLPGSVRQPNMPANSENISAGNDAHLLTETRPEATLPPENQDFSEAGEKLMPEMDDLMWVDDMDVVPEMNMNPEEDDARSPASELHDTASGDPGSPGHHESGSVSSLSTNSDQVPDDPDEAIAWLERLAARQGAPAEELPTVESFLTGAAAVSEDEDRFGLRTMDAGEIPEDPDEAMAWLEMLAAKEGANSDESATGQASKERVTGQHVDGEAVRVDEPSTSALSADLDDALDSSLPSGLDEALGWLEELTVEPHRAEDVALPAESLEVVEEPPTPAVAHDVEAALAGAEILFAEPEAGESTPGTDQVADEFQYDEADDAMAWLEQLAARQGAPIEELTTVDEALDELTEDDGISEAMAPADVEPTEVIPAEPSPIDVEPDIDEEVDEQIIELDQPEAEAREQAGQLSLDSVSDRAFDEGDVDTAVAVKAMAAELETGEEEVVEQSIEGREELPVQDELEIAAEFDAPAEDMAWLDTLGAVDAERWLEAEAAEGEDEIASELDEELYVDSGTLRAEPPTIFGASPDGPESETLVEARRAMEEGELAESLSRYSELVGKGALLAFLIDDLEVISEQRGPDPGLQRVLGDAYARNGQLRKALESYREALANL